jgi:hypothetical protein
MYTAERQRSQPYLKTIHEPLFEQWFLLHHRMVRIVTNRPELAAQVCHFLYYAEFLAAYTYDDPAQLPTDIPADLLWEVGERLHRPVAFTCYLFETQPGEAFPPTCAEPVSDTAEWEPIAGIDGPVRRRWRTPTGRFREYHPYPGVTGNIRSELNIVDLYATIYIEDIRECAPWFTMRYVFYTVFGTMFGFDGFEIIHAAAISLHDAGALIVGSPGSGKTTLALSCMQFANADHLADDVLFIAKEDDEVVYMYAFPEDIGIRAGSYDLLGQFEFMQNPVKDQRQKFFIDIQQHFREQVVYSCPVRFMFFVHEVNRCTKFKAKLLTPAEGVSWLMEEYISQQQAKQGNSESMLDIFTAMAKQSISYALCLTPDAQENASQVRALIEQHAPGPIDRATTHP